MLEKEAATDRAWKAGNRTWNITALIGIMFWFLWSKNKTIKTEFEKDHLGCTQDEYLEEQGH